MDFIICKFEFGGVSSEFRSYRDVKIMMRESLKMGVKDKRVFISFKRIVVYNIKYILRIVLGKKLYINLIKYYRK
jgi:hypothetical protein